MFHNTNLPFTSITWSYIFLISILLLTFFLKYRLTCKTLEKPIFWPLLLTFLLFLLCSKSPIPLLLFLPPLSFLFLCFFLLFLFSTSSFFSSSSFCFYYLNCYDRCLLETAWRRAKGMMTQSAAL